MNIWNSIDNTKPAKSGIYRVRTSCLNLKSVNYAYYDLMQDKWTHDDGFWLPMIITQEVTHWAELSDR